MILAISRFKVVNGLEGAVADAFARRPGLVDSWPGFLGLETFTDTSDPTVFHLVTRWTDSAAFHEWHKSAAHRESHRGMPKGLRLDPSYTQLIELERIAGQSHQAAVCVLDASAMIGTYLARTRAVHVLRCEMDGAVQFVNAAMAAHLGLPMDVVPGLSAFALLTEHDAAVLEQRLRSQAPSSDAIHLNFCDTTGAPFTLVSYVAVYPDGCLIIGEPVVEHDERLQQQLVETNAELAALARERQRIMAIERKARQRAETTSGDKDDALAVIAHELRQPLQAIAAALAVAKQNPNSAERAGRTVERQVGHMTALVEELLNASQVMRGAITLSREPTDLVSLTRELLDAIDAAARERNQRVTMECPVSPLIVDVDPRRIYQVLMNVLTNAMKYTPAGGLIAVFVGPVDDRTRQVRVTDSGDGIAMEALDRVFHLFVRASGGGNGLGIGLAVVRRLVELHDGTITVKSDGPGKGAQFTVTLPRATSAPVSSLGETVTILNAREGTDHGSLTV